MGFLNRALSIFIRKTDKLDESLFSFSKTTRQLAACAIASTINTPGIIGLSGKWP